MILKKKRYVLYHSAYRLGFPTGWNKGTEVLSLSWDKGTTGQAQNLAGTRQSPIFCQNPGRDRDGTGQSLIFPTFFCFRTSFSCLRTSFSCFFVSLGRWFCPGTFRDRGFCPGTFAPALARDKGTTGRPLLVCPGTSHGTYRPLETLVRVQGGN